MKEMHVYIQKNIILNIKCKQVSAPNSGHLNGFERKLTSDSSQNVTPDSVLQSQCILNL